MTTKILIIDDEIDICTSLKEILELSGYPTTYATSASEGLKQFALNSFDIVITDIVMAGMNGVEVIENLRRKNNKQNIIAISGGGGTQPHSYNPNAINTSAYLQAAISAGAKISLTKPFTAAEILEAIHSFN